MKRLQGGFGIGALVWVRGAAFVLAACMAAHAGSAQSVRLVPSSARFAGDGTSNPTNDGPGNAITIPLTAPSFVASDLSGNIYISDAGNNCIRRVDDNGVMTVLVGEGAGETCTAAGSVTTYTTGVLNPSGLALDAAGDLFVADTGHNCVRRLTAGATGIASLQPLVGTCTDPSNVSTAPAPSGLTVDSTGNLYIAINDAADNIFQVLRSSPANYSAVCLLSGAPSAAVPAGAQCPGTSGGVTLNAPLGLTTDPINNLYIADSVNACVREVSPAGVSSVAAGACVSGGTSSNGTVLQTPVSVTSDAVGHLYINDNAAGKVYELLGNQLAVVAGNGLSTPTYAPAQDGKAAVSYPLLNPQGLAADKAGNVYVADTNNNIVRILTQGLLFPATSVGNHSTPQNLWFMITNAVDLSSSPGGDFQPFGPNLCNGILPAPSGGQVETCQLSLSFLPTLPGLRTAPLTISDAATTPATNYRFGLSGIGQSAQAIFLPGTIKSLAKSLAVPSAIAIDSTGDVYYAESGGGSGNGAISVLPAGSSTPTQLIAPGAGVATPTALALDAAGTLYIADSTTNSILRYDTAGTLTTLVSGLDNPVALATDTLGNLYVAEDGASAIDVLQIYAGGQKAVLAGGGAISAPNNVRATSAKFVHPSALYLSPTGALYVADRGAFRVYRIDVTGVIHWFAGNGTPTDSTPGKRLGTGLAGVVRDQRRRGGRPLHRRCSDEPHIPGLQRPGT